LKPFTNAPSYSNKQAIFSEQMGTKNEKAGIASTQTKPCFDGEKTAKPIEITQIVEGAQCTAAYIAQLSGELDPRQRGALRQFGPSSRQGQLEAELWSCQGN
jgi:hypothetical protein